MRFFLLCALSFLVLLSGCRYKETYSGEWQQKIDSPDMTYLMMNYAEVMKHKYGMELEDSKVFYDETIEKIVAVFKTQDIVDMCEARKIFVDMVEEFLSRVNGHSLLGFELEHYFTADDLSFTIQFESFFTEFVDPLKVGVICLRDGIVSYFAGNIKDWHADWSAQRIEPYFKSLEIVQAQEAAELEYADAYPSQRAMQPHPFIFGKMVPIDEGNGRQRSGIFQGDSDAYYDDNTVEIPFGL